MLVLVDPESFWHLASWEDLCQSLQNQRLPQHRTAHNGAVGGASSGKRCAAAAELTAGYDGCTSEKAGTVGRP